MTELKRCPFCGGEATRSEYEDHGGRFWNYNVLCGNDNCPAGEVIASSIESQAAADAKWNKRTAPDDYELAGWRCKSYAPWMNGGFSWSFTTDKDSVTRHHQAIFVKAENNNVEVTWGST